MLPGSKRNCVILTHGGFTCQFVTRKNVSAKHGIIGVQMQKRLSDGLAKETIWQYIWIKHSVEVYLTLSLSLPPSPSSLPPLRPPRLALTLIGPALTLSVLLISATISRRVEAMGALEGDYGGNAGWGDLVGWWWGNPKRSSLRPRCRRPRLRLPRGVPAPDSRAAARSGV